jgi:hypothetical protein
MVSVKRLVVGSVVIATPIALRWWLTHRPVAQPVRGVVVTAEGGSALPGVWVEARDVVSFAVLGKATSGASGEFALTGVAVEEFGLWVDGSGVGRQQGYAATGGSVVPTWGEAVSWGHDAFPLTVRLALA